MICSSTRKSRLSLGLSMPSPKAKPKAKVLRGPRVPRTRNDGTMTEAQFWGWIRSQFRRMSMKWRPIYAKYKDSRRAATPEDRRKFGNRIKFTHQCDGCGSWFPRTRIDVDHTIPCGSLRSFGDCGQFLEKMLVERDGLKLLCTDKCHSAKTAAEREGRKG